MISRLPILLLLAALFATASRAADDSTNSPAPSGATLESFRVISERNIFNQSRSPRSARRETTERRPVPVVHALSLVGTMSYDKGDFAFFDGTNPDFRKPVQPGDTIAGYTVAEVAPSGVTLTNDTQQFEIDVGQQLRREDDGEWQLSTSTTRLTERAAGAEQTSSAAAESSSGGDSSEDEALRRLMEKRAKELNE